LGVDYFFRIPDALRKEGAKVYIARVSPAQTTEFRGEELVRQLKEWAALDGVEKFNLLGHSHGGPTVRYAANVVPEMVASVGSVAGAHQGTPVFDAGGPLNLPGGVSDAIATPAMKLIGFLTGTPSPNSASVAAAASSLSSEGSEVFNARFPAGAPLTPCGQGPEMAPVAGHPIRWYSYSGSKPVTNPLDPSDALHAYLSLYMGGQDNDGAVPRCSSHWGRVIKDNYAWNHLDEINQVLGLIGPLAQSPVAFYIVHASRLKQVGL
jgi:triacylglycerol lipase